MNVLVLHSQVPFVSGGAEVLVQGLARELVARGHTVDLVALPLSWNPPEGLLTSALAWRLLDLRRFNDRIVDRVICTKYPTWAVQHDHKVLWLIHQHRQAYDLYGSPLSELGGDVASREIRERVFEIDRAGITDCRARHAISRNVADRLRRYLGLEAGTLYPPVPRAGLSPEAYDPFILVAARLDAAKRIGCAIEALRHVQCDLRLEIVGDGPDRRALEALASRSGVEDRVVFHGRVDDDQLRRCYNRCRAVYYAPLDEDYGYSAVEALAAGKPVVTAPDSGGVLEFVGDGVTGLVSTLDPEALAAAFDRLADEELARALGAAGPERTASLNWDTVVSALLAG